MRRWRKVRKEELRKYSSPNIMATKPRA